MPNVVLLQGVPNSFILHDTHWDGRNFKHPVNIIDAAKLKKLDLWLIKADFGPVGLILTALVSEKSQLALIPAE